MSRSAFYLRLLHTAVLVNFAFTARLYDLLRREPTFFTVRQAGPLDIVALVAVLSLLLPGVFLLVEIIARGIGQRTWQIVHTVVVGLLVTLIAPGHAPRARSSALAAVADRRPRRCGGLAALLYARFALGPQRGDRALAGAVDLSRLDAPGLAGADGLFRRFRSAGRRGPRRPARARGAHRLR